MDSSPSAADAARTIRHRWLGLVSLTIGVALIIVDSTILNVAIPSIIDDLNIKLTTAQWANSIYSLVFAALLITFGQAGDIIGRRRMFMIGVSVFLVASALAGLAPNGALLLVARLLQGIGGAIILPSTLGSVNATFQGRDRATAFGIWGAVIGGSVALGPLLGGWFTTNLDWRWAFYINIPFGILAMLGVMRWIPESRDDTAERRWDVPGMLTLSTGLAIVIFSTIEGNTYGWWPQRAPFTIGSWTWPTDWISIIPITYVVGFLLLAWFTRIERSRTARGAAVLMDFSLYRIPSFRNGNFAASIVSLGEFGIVFVMPLFVQTVLGYSAWDTGLLLLALSGGAFFAGGAAAQLTRRFGARRIVSVGMLCEAVAISGLALVISTTVTWQVMAPILFVYGLGVGFATAQLTSVVLSDVPVKQSGQASGIQSTARQVGAALGIAILGSVFVFGLQHQSRQLLADIPGLDPGRRVAIAQTIERTAGAVKPKYGSDAAGIAAHHAVDEAIVAAARMTGFIAAGFVMLGFLASLRLPAPTGQSDRRDATADPVPDGAEIPAS